MNKVSERIRAATHESAHALVARVLGLQVQRVRLGRRPRCVLWLEKVPGEAARAAAACMAGSYGEEVGGLEPDRKGSRQDERRVRRLSLGDSDQAEARQAARRL